MSSVGMVSQARLSRRLTREMEGAQACLVPVLARSASCFLDHVCLGVLGAGYLDVSYRPARQVSWILTRRTWCYQVVRRS